MALAWSEPSPSDCDRFLERVRAGERVDLAAAAIGLTATRFRRHAARKPGFAAAYLAAVVASGRSSPGLVARLEALAREAA